MCTNGTLLPLWMEPRTFHGVNLRRYSTGAWCARRSESPPGLAPNLPSVPRKGAVDTNT